MEIDGIDEDESEPDGYLYSSSILGIIGSTEISSREWLQALHDDQPGERRKSMWWSRLLLLFHSFVVAVSIATVLWVLPLLVSFFPFTANWGSTLSVCHSTAVCRTTFLIFVKVPAR